ncbi:MAG: hypothetical protein IJ157_14405, partial [Clostridia bacterium]|nr:hypothetical protein [Clostridia bacterium]
SRISKSDRIELARFRSSFVVRRISGARHSPSPIQSAGGSNKHRQAYQHRPPKVFAQLSLESAYPLPGFLPPNTKQKCNFSNGYAVLSFLFSV